MVKIKNVVMIMTACVVLFFMVVSCDSQRSNIESILPTVDTVIDDADTLTVEEEEYVDPALYCDTEYPTDRYKLTDIYFNDSSELRIRHRVVYFTNGVDSSEMLDSSYFAKRIPLVNQYFSEYNIEFGFDDILIVNGRPDQDSISLQLIESLEAMIGYKREDIRAVYHISHMELWNRVFEQKAFMTTYVFDNIQDGPAGLAGGIGSTFAGVIRDYLDPIYHTLPHEIGHCLGLLHTHEDDDQVCDTYRSVPDLFKYIKDCEIQEGLNLPMPKERMETSIKLIMAYTDKECREEFTPEQGRRMKSTLDLNADLRLTIKDLVMTDKELFWDNLKVLK